MNARDRIMSDLFRCHSMSVSDWTSEYSESEVRSALARLRDEGFLDFLSPDFVGVRYDAFPTCELRLQPL